MISNNKQRTIIISCPYFPPWHYLLMYSPCLPYLSQFFLFHVCQSKLEKSLQTLGHACPLRCVDNAQNTMKNVSRKSSVSL